MFVSNTWTNQCHQRCGQVLSARKGTDSTTNPAKDARSRTQAAHRYVQQRLGALLTCYGTMTWTPRFQRIYVSLLSARYLSDCCSMYSCSSCHRTHVHMRITAKMIPMRSSKSRAMFSRKPRLKVSLTSSPSVRTSGSSAGVLGMVLRRKTLCTMYSTSVARQAS
jgi:hypothetical protein